MMVKTTMKIMTTMMKKKNTDIMLSRGNFRGVMLLKFGITSSTKPIKVKRKKEKETNRRLTQRNRLKFREVGKNSCIQVHSTQPMKTSMKWSTCVRAVSQECHAPVTRGTVNARRKIKHASNKYALTIFNRCVFSFLTDTFLEIYVTGEN